VQAESPISALQIHPDGQILGTCDDNKIVSIWDLRSQKAATKLEGHDSRPNCIAFNLNGYFVGSGDDSGVVNIWDLRKLEATAKLDNFGGNRVCALTFDNSGSYLAVGQPYGIELFQCKKWKERLASLRHHSKDVTGIRFDLKKKKKKRSISLFPLDQTESCFYYFNTENLIFFKKYSTFSIAFYFFLFKKLIAQTSKATKLIQSCTFTNKWVSFPLWKIPIQDSMFNWLRSSSKHQPTLNFGNCHLNVRHKKVLRINNTSKEALKLKLKSHVDSGIIHYYLIDDKDDITLNEFDNIIPVLRHKSFQMYLRVHEAVRHAQTRTLIVCDVL
ncbi:hypothetical protein RFI_13668, partial [Reticulomyxa filosa]